VARSSSGQPDAVGGQPASYVGHRNGGYPGGGPASHPPGQVSRTGRPAPPARTERPDPPVTVRAALALMHLGAACSGVIAVLAGVGNGSVFAATGAQASSGALYALYALGALALWLGVAAGVRRGMRGARLAAPLLFVLFTGYLLTALVPASESLTAFALLCLSWLIGAGAVVLLWLPPSGYFFRHR
jgi:hypothetical protein